MPRNMELTVMKLFRLKFVSLQCFLLAYAVQNDLLIHQMHVETAFLDGKIDEKIYMQQLEGYVKPGEKHLVCKLEKSLYGFPLLEESFSGMY